MLRSLTALTFLLLTAAASAAEVAVLTPETWEEYCPKGKEVDAVYGDVVLRTDDFVAVIARPVVTRNANMTVKGVGACLIDFTPRKEQNDQLSCFYPAGTRPTFTTLGAVTITVDGQPLGNIPVAPGKGKKIVYECTDDATPPAPAEAPPAGTKSDENAKKPKIRVTRRYTIEDGKPYLLVETIHNNPHQEEITEKMLDTIRADKVFQFGTDGEGKVDWAQDEFFRQTYGSLAENFKYADITKGNNFDFAGDDAELKLKPGESKTFTRKLFCGDSLVAVRSAIAKDTGTAVFPVHIDVAHAISAAPTAKLIFKSADGVVSTARTDWKGWSGFLPAGDYDLSVQFLGDPKKDGKDPKDPSLALCHSEVKQKLTVNADGKGMTAKIMLPEIGVVRFRNTDDEGAPLPCKVAFFDAKDPKKAPDFGPDSGEIAVKNLVYSHKGDFLQPLVAGEYEALVSHGMEYDVATVKFKVEAGKPVVAQATLKRSVDTKGWISADFHNHSTPSGDNVSSQLGRVLNLYCENIEYAPCTEHNRIDSYLPVMKQLGIVGKMATCTGIELTGSPLPINHQNAFPLIQKPREQDGGGPTPSINPVTQIERLSMWDGGAEKVVQMNHPNLPQILGDKDLDGQMDAGFEKMFRFTDVVEIHPIEAIFQFPEKDADYKQVRNPAVAWLQMLNLGYRIPGVVNTDAHYNFHGSGWMRNFLKCTTDDPAKIETPEMIKMAEGGHVFMTTGPYLTVGLTPTGEQQREAKTAIPGDDLKLPRGEAELHVQVQCANWLDINRVQVFLNGRPEKKLGFTRRENPKNFTDGVTKFEARLPLKFETDTHVVVACIGENLTLGRVFGPEFGKKPPAALANPIFVDVDGNGFKANGDLLDVPLLWNKEAAKRE